MKSIVGVFFQDVRTLHVGHDPEIGARVMLKDEELQALFMGIIEPVQDTSELGVNIDGIMHDIYGQSTIHDFVMTNTKLTFLKIYDRTGTAVEYTFKKENEKFWIGTWKNFQMSGVARCTITDIGEVADLYNRENIKDLLKK